MCTCPLMIRGYDLPPRDAAHNDNPDVTVESNAVQSEAKRSKEAETNDDLGSEAPIETFVDEHRAEVEEYAGGNNATAWLIEGLLSWAERDGRANEVTEQ